MFKTIAIAVAVGVAGLTLAGCVYEDGYAYDPYYDGVYAGGAVIYDRDYRVRPRYRHAHRAERPRHRPHRSHRDWERRSFAGHRIWVRPGMQDDRH